MKSLPLPKDAHHCLTNKYIKVHLCLKSLILLHVSFSAEISVRESVQGKWCCSAARGVGLSAESLQVFSPELRLFKVMAKGQSTSQMISQSTAQRICPCFSRHRLLWCVSGSRHPDRDLSSCQGKEPNLQGGGRDAWGAEEISRDSEDFTSKAALSYGKNNLVHTYTHKHICAILNIYIYTHKKKG